MPGRLLALERFGLGAKNASKSNLDRSSISSSSSSELNSAHVDVTEKKKKRSLRPASKEQPKGMDAIKRRSLIGRHHPEHSSDEAPKAATLDVIIESPPIVFHGSTTNSTGALISARLKLDVLESNTKFTSIEARFYATSRVTKPVSQHCPECSTITTELKKWNFTGDEPTTMPRGRQELPFSILIPGHLPASTHGKLAIVEYHLTAHATTSTGETANLHRLIDVKRALYPGPDKNSLRVFPPTELTAAVQLPSVIHPIGDFDVQLRLSGVTKKKEESQTRWRLRKLNWRVEEREKMMSPACPKHSNKIEGEVKAIPHEETRVVGSGDLKEGWKSHFADGTIECQFKGMLSTNLHPQCDVQAGDALEIKHTLVIEMVVAEEWSPAKNPTQVTPTGSARVLRTQFTLVLTERGGLGVAWDEEIPPQYDDVPASPPHYQSMDDFDMADIEQDLRGFALS